MTRRLANSSTFWSAVDPDRGGHAPAFLGTWRSRRWATEWRSFMGTKRKRRNFTAEYKAEAVRLARTSGKTAHQSGRELDLTSTAVRAWIKQADVDAGKGQTGELTT